MSARLCPFRLSLFPFLSFSFRGPSFIRHSFTKSFSLSRRASRCSRSITYEPFYPQMSYALPKLLNKTCAILKVLLFLPQKKRKKCHHQIHHFDIYDDDANILIQAKKFIHILVKIANEFFLQFEIFACFNSVWFQFCMWEHLFSVIKYKSGNQLKIVRWGFSMERSKVCLAIASDRA